MPNEPTPSVNNEPVLPPWAAYKKVKEINPTTGKVTYKPITQSNFLDSFPAVDPLDTFPVLDQIPQPSDYMIQKKKKQKAEPTTDTTSTRSSIFGTQFHGSIESDWERVDVCGTKYWLHRSEKELFAHEYKICFVTNVCARKVYMSRTVYEDIWYRPEASIPNGWVECSITGRWVKLEDTITVVGSADGDVNHRVYKGIAEDELSYCDFYHQHAHPAYVVQVKGSKNYKIISHKALHENKDIFKSCNQCGQIYENIEDNFSLLNGGAYCSGCVTSIKYKNLIKPHNHKGYPAPLFNDKTRYGSVIKNGLVFATGKKEPVKSIRLFGAEAEVELAYSLVRKASLSRHDIAYECLTCLGTDFVIIKEDGTLTMNGKYSGDPEYSQGGERDGKRYAGFEIVSAPADLETHRLRWGRLDGWKGLHTANGTKLLRAWDTTTCGFHVHVSRDSLSNLQIGRMLRFINHPNNQPFIFKVAGRGSDRFCMYYDKQLVDALYPDRVISKNESDAYNRSRRVALNISNPKTVEFRIFRGTIHPRHILRNLEFCDAVCDFCYPSARSFKEIDDYHYFIDFAKKRAKQWPLLAEWLMAQSFITIKKVGKKADVSKLTCRPELCVE